MALVCHLNLLYYDVAAGLLFTHDQTVRQPQGQGPHVSLNPLTLVTICLFRPPPPPLSDPVQLPALGLACRSVHLYLLYVGGWSSSTVSGQPYLDHGRYGTAEASVSDDTLVKTHRPPVCVCVAVLTCTCGGLQNVFINVY